ncbi:RNA-binding protein Ro60-like [Hetaerina americana]|uniref:RNA-binding protein Ro60-like n=1 Tax=Hetaerina americana TaxID=62018 RepID=UPI003A7F5382
MGDGAKKESTGKEVNVQKSQLRINMVVPGHIQRFLYLGTESGVYHSKANHPKGYPSVDHLGFNYLKAWDLGLFSDEMVENSLKKQNNNNALLSFQEKSLSKNNEDKTTPRDGWPSPGVVHLAKEVLKSYKGACRPAAIFVLAACSRAEGPARSEAFSAAAELQSPEDILLFIKYATDLTPNHKGWGAGIRRAIKGWYVDQCGSMELAEKVTRIRQRHSWSHKDVLKLVHLKPKDPVQAMVFGYVMFDLQKLHEHFKKVPDTEPLQMEANFVMKYLEAADQLRKLRIPKGSNEDCNQVLEAVDLIKTHKFTVEHCDDTMLLAPKIWEAALEHMTFWQLLVYLPILRFNRVTKAGCELTKIIVNNLKSTLDALTHSSDSKIHPPVSPALVLISMQTYRRKHSEVVPTKLWFKTHALMGEIVASKSEAVATVAKDNQNKSHGEPKHPRPPKDMSKPNSKILELMGKILVASIKQMKPTQKRFIFGVGNIRDKVSLINPYVVSFEAAALIYMCLEAAEADGSVKGYAVPVDGKACRKFRNAGSSLSNCVREIMQEMSTDPINVDGWLDWLSNEKCSADVIVLVADEVLADNRSAERLKTSFINYKKTLMLPEAKLVIVSLVSKNLPECSYFHDDTLMVHGFDSNLPFIIQHFAQGRF